MSRFKCGILLVGGFEPELWPLGFLRNSERQIVLSRGERMEQLERQPYKNISGVSGVHFFAVGPSFIRVWFKGGGYEYDHVKPGAHHVAAMKRLAEEGRGLATYINQHVRTNFARKI